MTVTVVTGGAGFVGRHLVKALIARGERVRVMDLSPSPDAETMIGSIDDPAAAAEAVAGADAVFHLAGNAQLWAKDASEFERVNHQGTKQMLAAAAKAGVRRFIHCSSLTTLVGRRGLIGLVDESTRLAPGDMLGAYPRSKLMAEFAVEEAVKGGLDAVIAMPTEPLGAGDETLTPPTRMILDLLNGKTPATIDCTLNFVAAKSLADGLIAARDRGRCGERYLFGGENVAMRRLLATLEKISGRKMPRTKLPYAVALAAGVIDTLLVSAVTGKPPKAPLTGVRLAGRRLSFSSAKAKRELEWQSAPFEEALADLLKWIADRKA